MADMIQFKRSATPTNSTLEDGEPGWDSTLKTLFMGDGAVNTAFANRDWVIAAIKAAIASYDRRAVPYATITVSGKAPRVRTAVPVAAIAVTGNRPSVRQATPRSAITATMQSPQLPPP